MPLYVVKHMHPAERCPAQDSTMASMLLMHLSKENAEKFGVNVRSEAVADGRHMLFLILEANDKSSVERFMQPFAQAGTIEVMPASPCEVVVERGAC
ncbi:MAG: sulfite oxidase [Ignavibacteriae bacterium]|nr:sulfite oxidase [Ignavibacteriota bacterium]